MDETDSAVGLEEIRKTGQRVEIIICENNNEFIIIFFFFLLTLLISFFRFTFVDEDHFDDRVVRDVDLMGAHAVGATVGWPVIAIAKLFGRDVVDLRKRRRRRKCERDFIDERDYVISGRCDCGEDKVK